MPGVTARRDVLIDDGGRVADGDELGAVDAVAQDALDQSEEGVS